MTKSGLFNTKNKNLKQKFIYLNLNLIDKIYFVEIVYVGNKC